MKPGTSQGGSCVLGDISHDPDNLADQLAGQIEAKTVVG